MRIDHVTVGGPDLADLESRFRATGLEPVYGGRHSNGVTHMSIVALGDGSYVELISAVDPADLGRDSFPWWGGQIAGDGGPCAWCVRVDDIAAEIERLRAAGVPVRGPVAMNRKLPDGRSAEWEVAFAGDGEPGSLLPFMIEDKTPREIRVPAPTTETATRVAAVVLGVEALEPAVALFRRAYGWPEPAPGTDADFGARLARFEGTPVTLAAPDGPGRLADRLARFGPCPLAFVLESAITASASSAVKILPP